MANVPSYLSFNLYFMIKYLLVALMTLLLVQGQYLTPYYILPVQNTQDIVTSYAFLFYTDTPITNNAQVVVIFPAEFSPTDLAQVTKVRYALGGNPLQVAEWSVSLNIFTLSLGSIAIGNVSLLIDSVRNPNQQMTSGYFMVRT